MANLFTRVAVLAHPQVPEAAQEAGAIAGFLQERGLTADHGLLYDEPLRADILTGRYDLLIALGGDGTMLRAGHLCGPLDLPLLGINLGRFGFLTEIRRSDWAAALTRLLAGEYWLERRMMLRAAHMRHDEVLGTWDVLNEISIGRGQQVRPVHLDAYVDERFLTTYVADALIAATPTGSTAYALAAGGPILAPELRNILLVAVAPHLSLDRAVVLAEGSEVRIGVQEDMEVVLSVDGQPPILLGLEDVIRARASQHAVSFVRFQDPGYFYRNLTIHMNRNPTTGNHR
jgi:NAD+ kinase